MNRILLSLAIAALAGGGGAYVALASDHAEVEAAPVFVTEIPDAYRDWKLVSVAREAGDLDDIRAILGNDIAVEAYRNGQLPFPDGAILARIAWTFESSAENDRAFGRPQSFVAGAPKNGLQFMVKDSRKYAATGGWGFGQFGEKDHSVADAATLAKCAPCHQAVADRDRVFTRYSP